MESLDTDEHFDADDSNFDMIQEFSVQIFNDFSSLQHTIVVESAKIYVCRYAAHPVSKKLHCSECISFITKTKGTNIENEYYDHLQRNGLSAAKERLCYIFIHMLSIMEYRINDELLKNNFLKVGKQNKILCLLTFQSIKEFVRDKLFDALIVMHKGKICGKNKGIEKTS